MLGEGFKGSRVQEFKGSRVQEFKSSRVQEKERHRMRIRYSGVNRFFAVAIGQFLRETNQSLGAEDEGRFSLRLLHFRRTFVEKMFAIHSKVEILKRDVGMGGKVLEAPGTLSVVPQVIPHAAGVLLCPLVSADAFSMVHWKWAVR
jgi:hypothetical protein